MKILVTGGAGYIGSVLTNFLAKLDHDVTIFDNFFFKQEHIKSRLLRNNINIIHGDVRDEKLLFDAVKKKRCYYSLSMFGRSPFMWFISRGSNPRKSKKHKKFNKYT